MTTRILALASGEQTPRHVSMEDLPALLTDGHTTLWIDMANPGELERSCLVNTFRLHPLVVDDLIAAAPTPKIERFDEYVYLVFHALLPGWENAREFGLGELDVMIGRNFLLTSHEETIPSVENAFALAQRDSTVLAKGPAFCAYTIADVLTERFLPMMERVDHDIDALETAILKQPGPKLLETVLELKHKLQKIRRLGIHQREVLNQLSRAEKDLAFIPEEVKPFFRDAYDNFVRVVDLNDSFREIVDSSMDVYLSMQGHKLNEIMKVLTLISTIMLPLTFIAGVYGMNFEDMPELHWHYGYFAALGAMGLTAIVFFAYFKRKGWI